MRRGGVLRACVVGAASHLPVHERWGGLLHAGLVLAFLACFCLEPDLPGMAIVDLLILLKHGAYFEMIVDSFSVVSSETVIPCARLTPTEVGPTARRGVPPHPHACPLCCLCHFSTVT